jgi:2-haloalkanoic acid dehalogenase type II
MASGETMTQMRPALITFDVFGTIIDWRSGLQADLVEGGVACSDELFEQIIAAQAALETGPFRTYREITAASLVQVVGLDADAADEIGQRVGCWPLYADAREALHRLQQLGPCIAMTNSDRIHGKQVQEQFGFSLNDWVCAEEIHAYKPDPAFWHAVAARRHVKLDSGWWHASAYADYDLGTASKLGLTTVFVKRAHSLPGPAQYHVTNLRDLAEIVERLKE